MNLKFPMKKNIEKETMAWRILPNEHSGDCAFRSAAQLLGWPGENYMRLRRECANDVRDLSLDRLAFLAYTYGAAYDEPTTRHEVRWMAPFAGRNMSDDVLNGTFRYALARAIETPGNVFWGDHFTLELISNRYNILFLTVRNSTNNITIMPSRLSDAFDGDLRGLHIGFLLAQSTVAFDAICYTSARAGDCIASITQKDLDENIVLAEVVYAVLSRPRLDVRFPMSIKKLLAQSRFKRRETMENEDATMNDLSTRLASIDVRSPIRKSRNPKVMEEEEEENTSSVVNRVRNPETKRCININGPTWRKHRAIYGDRVFSYEIC